VIVYRRLGPKEGDDLLVLLNLTPVPRLDWQLSMNDISYVTEIFNSDAEKYWGTGKIYNPDIRIEKSGSAEGSFLLTINLPPLAGVILK
jgi:1,4-alpha-glucan branching enzyme